MKHCHHYLPRPTTRREMLMQATHGFGGVALAAMLAGDLSPAASAAATDSRDTSPQQPRSTPHTPQAKRVIFLYMDGGPSQVDTFDPKPALSKYNGQDPHRVFKV